MSVETQLIPFLSQLRTLYRNSNRYHSFVHAVDVLQGIYYFLTRAGVVPPLWQGKGQMWHRTDREQEGSLTYLLRDGDVFLLCLAAIGHDVGHPGNSNAFLVSLGVDYYVLAALTWYSGGAEKCTGSALKTL